MVALGDAGDLAGLREAIGKLDGGDVGEALLMAVMKVVSLEAALALCGPGAGQRDADESPGEGAEELPVDDPWVDPNRPYSSMLDRARQLRMALLDVPDLPSLLNAFGALSADECGLIVLEMGFDAWWGRTHGGR